MTLIKVKELVKGFSCIVKIFSRYRVWLVAFNNPQSRGIPNQATSPPSEHRNSSLSFVFSWSTPSIMRRAWWNSTSASIAAALRSAFIASDGGAGGGLGGVGGDRGSAGAAGGGGDGLPGGAEAVAEAGGVRPRAEAAGRTSPDSREGARGTPRTGRTPSPMEA